jgi:hypothetical protein
MIVNLNSEMVHNDDKLRINSMADVTTVQPQLILTALKIIVTRYVTEQSIYTKVNSLLNDRGIRYEFTQGRKIQHWF